MPSFRGFLLFTLIALSSCVEIVPHASGLRSQSSSNIRRSPASFAPLARSLRPSSTGVRRAPEVPLTPVRLPYRPSSPPRRAPLPPPTMLPLLPLPQFIPVPVPVLSPIDLQNMPTLATLPPHTLPTFTPIPGMPTMPGLTLPPSFQRLLGITTTTMKPAVVEKSVEYRNEEEDTERRPTYNKDLNTVRSRLSKFVRGEKKASKAEENADWIVPFH